MDTLPSSPTPTKRATASEASPSVPRKARAAEDEGNPAGATSAAGFSKLLKAAAQPDAGDAGLADGRTVVLDPSGGGGMQSWGR